MTPLGMKFTVIRSAADTNGESLELHWEVYPGCNMKDPLIHTHPHAIETYDILDGEMEFYIKDKWLPAKKGDKLSVPKGVPHMFRNPTDKTVTVFNTHQPALKMENYFEDACKVIDVLTENRTKDLNMNLRGKMYLSALMNNYREEIIAVSPPDFLIKLLGAVGKMFGVKY